MRESEEIAGRLLDKTLNPFDAAYDRPHIKNLRDAMLRAHRIELAREGLKAIINERGLTASTRLMIAAEYIRDREKPVKIGLATGFAITAGMTIFEAQQTLVTAFQIPQRLGDVISTIPNIDLSPLNPFGPQGLRVPDVQKTVVDHMTKVGKTVDIFGGQVNSMILHLYNTLFNACYTVAGFAVGPSRISKIGIGATQVGLTIGSNVARGIEKISGH